MDLGAEPRSPGYKESISPNDISGAHYGPEQEVRDEAPSRAQRGARRNLLETQRRRIRPGCRLPAEAPEDKAEAPSGIGDLVLAAELMEMAWVSPCYAQPRGGTQLAVQHDHGAYGVPQEPAALGRMVRELQETVHRQSQLLQSLQEALAASQERCQELQERSASECWALASELGQRIVALEAENRNLRCEREQLESQTQGLREELERSRGTVLHISHKLKEQGDRGRPGRFCLASVRGDGKWLRFYTGFGSAQRLAAFLAFLTEGEPQRGAEPGPPSALSPEDQLFLVLVRLRLGLLLQDLAFRFHLSEATASRYWLSWTQLMETRLAQVPVRCSPRYVERFEPRRAAWVGGVPLVVLDCAQLCFEGRGRRLYALQGCALAAPSGFLAFCCSAALRGGEGAVGPGLPPFLRDGPVALSARQGEASRQVLSLADKALRFRFLRGVQPPAMEGQVGRAWAICCYLACLLHEPMGLP
ncbi:uncharacterized protein LOC127036517 isoform X2 [Gopherus flavomarginatus]|uniref:uncharacterized protein LOC127036517 isoform X2 n=1 Tax=Gopherus flavomarginatus TaxID=286002 RepID=UPI0021CC46EB|nr:uncharacterized protein LOC127036517 isoform X2 [Gopherus flavomarginatus]